MTQSGYDAEDLIHKALYPRWKYTGGYIFATVDGSEVTLQGYADPAQQESELLIRKVKDSLGWEPKIYWQRIGSTNKPALLPLLPLEAKQKPETHSHSELEYRNNRQASDLLKVVSIVRKQAENEAIEDIHALVKFFEDKRRAIENKSTEDIQTLVRLVEDAKKAIAASIKYLAESLTYTKEQACQLLDHATHVAGQVLASLRKTIIDLWNPEWVDILLKAMTRRTDLDKAKDEVKKLQLDYLHEKPIQIANRIIWNKTLLSTTAVGFSSAIKETASTIEKLELSIALPKTSTILVEMVYQIAVAYGFDNLENPAQKGEFLAVFAIALGSQQIMKLGLSFLGKHTPIQGLLIDATTNVILFQLLGYAASQFYEAKVKAISPLTSIEAYTTLEEKAKAYLQKAISQKEAVREIVADAVSIQEQLALA